MYFTLNPLDIVGELTQYDLEKVFKSLTSESETNTLVNDFIINNKFRPLLRRIQDFTDDKTKIPEESAKNLIKVLNNVSDHLEDEKEGMFDIGISMEIVRVIYQSLSKFDKSKNFEVLKSIIAETKGIFGILHLISIETQGFEKNPEDDKLILINSDLLKLQKIIAEKIENTNINDLLDNKHFQYIINRWKDWGDEKKIEEFINDLKNNEELILRFLNHFISESRSMSVGSYGENIFKQIAFTNLKRFINLDEVNNIMNEIKKNIDMSQGHKELVEMFDRDYQRYLNNPDKYSNYDFE
jgi:hypothetical protein